MMRILISVIPLFPLLFRWLMVIYNHFATTIDFHWKKNWTEEEAWSFLAAEDLLLIIALEVRENARWMTNHTPPVLGCKPFRREIRWCYHPKKLTRKGLKGFSWGNLGIFQRFRFLVTWALNWSLRSKISCISCLKVLKVVDTTHMAWHHHHQCFDYFIFYALGQKQ